MKLNYALCLALVSAAVALWSVPETIAGGPAVSGLNGKITPFGGSFGTGGAGDTGVGGVEGSLTMPLGHSFGIQFDGAYARMSDDDFWSSGAHVFWRDPDVGMIGVYTGYSWLDQFGGIDVGIVALEAQRFSHRFTLDGAIGYTFADADDIFGRAKIDYYPTEDLMLSAGYAYEMASMATIGAEYQFASSDDVGTALFATGSVGENGTYSVLGGMRVFLGENMTLINRHRKQDPASYTGMAAASAGQVAAAAVAAASLGAKAALPVRPVCPTNACVALGSACDCPSGTTRKSGFVNATSFSCDPDGCSFAGHCASWGC